MDNKIESILNSVQKPARYIGKEWNSVRKAWDQDYFRFLLAFPDIYEIGMSHLGIKILYGLLNERKDLLCERVFAPWPDMEQALRAEHVKLFSLESKEPIDAFDIIGFSLTYELSYTNVLTIMDLGGIPVRSNERDETHPLILAGGPCSVNPEPMADFIDAFVIGDGEEVILEVVDTCKRFSCAAENRRKGSSRRWSDHSALLEGLAKIEGVYVPSLVAVEYRTDGSVRSFSPKNGTRFPVKKRIVHDLDAAYYPTRQIVPYIQVVHDRISLEIMRGCKNFCKFCQATATYSPQRERSLEKILELAKESYMNTGYEEIALVSLSSGDHSRILEIIRSLNDEFRDKAVSISFPSLRIEENVSELPNLISLVKKTGLTFAPECGSDRLRRSLNKNIRIDALLSAAREAYKAGWKRIKLYFMIGLPTENDEDLLAIIDLIEAVSLSKRKVNGSPALVTASISPFVPKPHTPFQRTAMASLEELKRKKSFLISHLSKRRLRSKLDFHDFSMSFLEGVFSRGDRRLSRVIAKAWEKGAKFDSWREFFKIDCWLESFEALGIRPEDYIYANRDAADLLPWDCIDVGLQKETSRVSKTAI